MRTTDTPFIHHARFTCNAFVACSASIAALAIACVASASSPPRVFEVIEITEDGRDVLHAAEFSGGGGTGRAKGRNRAARLPCRSVLRPISK